MSPLNVERIESLIRRIDFVEMELSDLNQLKPLNYDRYSDDRTLRRNVERIIENVMNACADIAKILAVSEQVPIPESYRETLRWLGRARILSPEEAERLSGYVTLRNFLAHEYLDLRWKEIAAFLADGPPIVHQLTRQVRARIAAYLASQGEP